MVFADYGGNVRLRSYLCATAVRAPDGCASLRTSMVSTMTRGPSSEVARIRTQVLRSDSKADGGTTIMATGRASSISVLGMPIHSRLFGVPRPPATHPAPTTASMIGKAAGSRHMTIGAHLRLCGGGVAPGLGGVSAHAIKAPI